MAGLLRLIRTRVVLKFMIDRPFNVETFSLIRTRVVLKFVRI